MYANANDAYANANAAYLESRLLSADPVELIRILYEAAASAVEDARQRLAAGEIIERSRSINKACGILAELIRSLDRERGGEVAERLSQLYGYMYARLVEANRLQADAPLADVLGLLSTLAEAWKGAKANAEAPQAAAVAEVTPKREAEEPSPASYSGWSYGAGASTASSPWAQPFPPEPATAYAPRAWSF
jgi:flagellar protein FliS